jgi:hypothetical protein
MDIIVTRHPDYENDIRVFGGDATVVDIDLGGMDLSDPEEFTDWSDSQLLSYTNVSSPEAREFIIEAVVNAASEHGHDAPGWCE